jgi:hypothetical protein
VINTSKPKVFTPEQIEEFEANNKSRGKVQHARFQSDLDPDKPAEFWLVKPNRTQLEAISDAKTASKGNDLLINCCVLAGDVDQLDNDLDMLLGLLETCSGLVDAKKKL